MKAVSIIKILLVAIASLVMAACEKDGDKMMLSGLESSDLMATAEEVILSQQTSKELVLSLAWETSTLTINDPSVSVPNILTTYIQVSTQNDFSSNVAESLEKSLSKAYTGAELNTVAKNVAAEPDVATTFYFRLKGSVGNNIAPVYSNIVEVDITSYFIDMTVGIILDKDKADTGHTLYSPDTNGIYKGFMGAVSWGNFFLREGDGTTWGNDAIDGTAFLMSSDEANQWNFWFPAPTGCYYVEVNGNDKLWSALSIPTLTVSGDVAADMVFDRPNVRWTTTVNTTTATTLKIKLQGTGKQYDYATGTDDNLATDSPIFFAAGNNGNIILGKSAEEISVVIPSAGEYTLVVDLSNPLIWKCEATEGSTTPVETNPYVYLAGVDDGSNGGSWTFDNTLSLYNEEDLAYAGVVNINSLWGYGIYTEKDNWDGFYKSPSGDAYSGTLIAGGENNIPAPSAGTYLINTSLKKLTYNLTKLENTIYVLGLHDQWLFDIPLTKTATEGVYAGSVTINSASEWGFQIHIDTSWNNYYGGAAGKLGFKGSNITDDASLAPGTYQMTVDLINKTYTIVK